MNLATLALAAATLQGAFALTGVPQRIDGTMTATGSAYEFRFTRHGTHRPVVRFEVEMTKTMHLIATSDDFSSFVHVHPSLRHDGAFAIAQRELGFEPDRRYYLYADVSPHGIGQQVMRFAYPAGIVHPDHVLAYPPAAVADVDGYRVALGSARLKAGAPSILDATIEKNGKPASDLALYLGASAHVVLIDTVRLTYVHVHPMGAREEHDMSGMAGMSATSSAMASPTLKLHLPALAAGTYKMWLQFRGGGRLHVAPLTLAVS